MSPTKLMAGRCLQLACIIEPELDEGGSIKLTHPQRRYNNVRGQSLHRYGRGAFCRFRIPADLEESGVYAITTDEQVVYVGECQDLAWRFNSGYGNISPRAAYEDGQPTNCRINKCILKACKHGKSIRLWFLPTDDRKKIERELIPELKPSWNKR